MAQLGLVKGGQTGLFTPMYMVFARKPPALETLNAAEDLDGTDSKGNARRGARKSETSLSIFQLQMVLCAAIIGCCISMSLPLAHLVAHATDKGLPLTDAVTVLSVTLMAAFISRVLCVGFLSDRFGGLWALFAFSALQAAMVGLLTASDSVAVLYIVGLGFGLGVAV